MLCKYLSYLTNENKQKEFYLTDIIEIIKREEQINIGLYEVDPENKIEITGVNTIAQLAQLETLINKNNNKIEIK